ncbi:MAG: O-antigen ligase family protein [Magnetococcales bacterium]|nr:O-antigen ligase family protein [Magnetococcales bacterium]
MSRREERKKQEEALRPYPKLFFFFLAIMVWIPLPLGSNRVWSLHLMTALLFLTLLIWAVSQIIHKAPLGHGLEDHPTPILLLTLWALYPLIQMIPMPEALLERTSGSTVAMLRYAGLQGDHSLSLDLHATQSAWLLSMASLAAVWLTLALATTRHRLRLLAYTIVFAGAFQALYGLFEVLTGHEHVWWIPKHTNKGYVTGTFINRNHLAGFMGLTIPIAFGLMIAWMRSHKNRYTVGEGIQNFMNNLSSKMGLMGMLVVVMFLGLFLSQSRAGSMALFASLFLITISTLFRRRRSYRERRLIVPLILVSIIAGGYFGLGHLTGRFINQEFIEMGRQDVFEATMRKIADYPFFGTGGGTFQFTFPLYRSDRLHAFYDHVHNDHLEVMSDFGLFGYALLVAAIVAFWSIMFRNYMRRRDPLARGMLFASLTASLSFVLHSLVDFNFHIPSNRILFLVILAMGLQATVLPHKTRGKRQRDIPGRSLGESYRHPQIKSSRREAGSQPS